MPRRPKTAPRRPHDAPKPFITIPRRPCRRFPSSADVRKSNVNRTGIALSPARARRGGGRGKGEPGKQQKQPDDGKSALRSTSVVEIELHVAKKGGSKGVPIRRGRGGPDPTRQCSSYYSFNRAKRNRFTSFYNLKVDWEAQGEHRRTRRHALFPFPVQAQV